MFDYSKYMGGGAGSSGSGGGFDYSKYMGGGGDASSGGPSGGASATNFKCMGCPYYCPPECVNHTPSTPAPQCPYADLKSCIDECPSAITAVYGKCVGACVKMCPVLPTSSPTTAPTSTTSDNSGEADGGYSSYGSDNGSRLLVEVADIAIPDPPVCIFDCRMFDLIALGEVDECAITTSWWSDACMDDCSSEEVEAFKIINTALCM